MLLSGSSYALTVRSANMLSSIKIGVCQFTCCGVLLLSFGLLPAHAATEFWRAPSAGAFSPAIKTVLRKVRARTANFQVQDVLGYSGQPIPVEIELDQALSSDPNGQLFIFSGIPSEVKLNPGGDFGQFWAVNSNALSELMFLAPEGFSGSFEVTVTQTGTSPNDPKLSAAFSVTVTAPEKADSAPMTIASVVSNPESKPVPETVERPSPPPATVPNLRDEKLMERAAMLFSNGDISGARSVFQYLTARGNAQAAFALAGTYDPIVLGPLFVKGLSPDPEQAEIWYKKAEEMGSPTARRHLDALARR